MRRLFLNKAKKNEEEAKKAHVLVLFYEVALLNELYPKCSFSMEFSCFFAVVLYSSVWSGIMLFSALFRASICFFLWIH